MADQKETETTRNAIVEDPKAHDRPKRNHSVASTSPDDKDADDSNQRADPDYRRRIRGDRRDNRRGHLFASKKEPYLDDNGNPRARFSDATHPSVKELALRIFDAVGITSADFSKSPGFTITITSNGDSLHVLTQPEVGESITVRNVVPVFDDLDEEAEYEASLSEDDKKRRQHHRDQEKQALASRSEGDKTKGKKDHTPAVGHLTPSTPPKDAK